MKTMTKKERLAAVDSFQEPDVMPVFPRIMAQAIYAKGWKLSDVVNQTDMDGEKVADAILTSLKEVDYDLAFGTYTDHGFGVPVLGGVLEIPEKFGVSVSIKKPPVEKREDWSEVKKKLPLDILKDGRCRGALESIKIVSKEVGDHTPIFACYYTGITAANILFRKVEELTIDAMEVPEFVDEMCRAATEFCKDWIRAQYEAGCNSFCYLGDHFGTDLMSPKMGERFILPYLADTVEMVKKEFGQKTYLHIHGNFKGPKSYQLLERLVKEAGVAGIHLDEKHDPQWIKENIIEKLKVPAGIIVHGSDPLVCGPVEKIDQHVKEAIETIGSPGLGYFMAPSCQVLPDTPNEHFKAWVDATHKYGKYPIASKG